LRQFAPAGIIHSKEFAIGLGNHSEKYGRYGYEKKKIRPAPVFETGCANYYIRYGLPLLCSLGGTG
jgi:hypothetical protein